VLTDEDRARLRANSPDIVAFLIAEAAWLAAETTTKYIAMDTPIRD
jgi:hypothetical protein